MMADNSTQTSKKSGFSFRKRKGNSKSRKNDDVKPVEVEIEQEVEMAKCDQHSTTAGDNLDGLKTTDTAIETESTETKSIEDEATAVGMQSSSEDSSPKGVQNGESPPEGSTKKKAKRRSLFRRNGKKNAQKFEEDCVEASKESAAQEQHPEAVEKKAADPSTDIDTKEQVVCDKSERRNEIRDQSDGEYATSAGEASEAEGEVGAGKSDIEGGEELDNGTADQSGDEKKGGQKRGTKRRGFFKRGLLLKRSKAKKKQDGGESKAEKVAAKEAENSETGVAESSFGLCVTQRDNNKTKNGELQLDTNEDNEASRCEIFDEAKTEGGKYSSAITKERPAKPVRKVSFVEPEYAEVESSDEGDSPSEVVAETGDELEDATPLTTFETPPAVAEPIVVSSCTDEPAAEADDDDLTEVSSLASSLLVSSDAPSQVDAKEVQLFVFIDTEESGSRITLVEDSDIGEETEVESVLEADKKIPEVSRKIPEVIKTKPEVDEKILDVDETTPKVNEKIPEVDEKLKDGLEGDKLLGEVSNEKKHGEWEMVNQSYDMSVELQRVRKQTLFGFKRLCCSVM